MDSNGFLRLKGLAPLDTSADDGVASFEIKNAKITNSVIDSAQMSNITLIETDRIDIVGAREGTGMTDVYIKGTLLVHGPVQGSGPYIDNSDKRLKKNIVPLTSVLDKIDDVQAVSYFMSTFLKNFVLTSFFKIFG